MAKVLLIDDEQSVEATLRSYLEIEGHEVVSATNFDSAVNWIKKDRADLIITDVILGQKTGLDVLREAKKCQPDTPVIVITGQPSIQTATRCVKDGAFDFLEKPLSPDNFIDATRRAIKTANRAKRQVSLKDKNKEKRKSLGKLIKQKNWEIDRTLKELIKSEDKYRSLISAVPELILEVDNNFKCTRYNDVAKEFFGHSLYNQPFQLLASPGEDRIILASKLEFLDEVNEPINFKFKCVKSDQNIEEISWLLTALKNPSGTRYGYLLTGRRQ
jgi:DNA-binding response OmpR family regulator